MALISFLLIAVVLHPVAALKIRHLDMVSTGQLSTLSCLCAPTSTCTQQGRQQAPAPEARPTASSTVAEVLGGPRLVPELKLATEESVYAKRGSTASAAWMPGPWCSRATTGASGGLRGGWRSAHASAMFHFPSAWSPSFQSVLLCSIVGPANCAEGPTSATWFACTIRWCFLPLLLTRAIQNNHVDCLRVLHVVGCCGLLPHAGVQRGLQVHPFLFFIFLFLSTVVAAFVQAYPVRPGVTSSCGDSTISSSSGFRHRASTYIVGDEFSTHYSIARRELNLRLSRPFFNRCMTRSFHLAVLAFGDTSAYRSDYIMITLTGEATGRLLRYDPATGVAAVLASGLSFPNGVALSTDGTHVVVAETTRCRLLRHWLRGPAAGTTEPFADLPGYPDNVRRADDYYWVALNKDKSWLTNGTTARSVAAVRVHGETGAVTEALRGLGNATVSEVVERPGGALWLGSVDTPYVGLLKVDGLL